MKRAVSRSLTGATRLTQDPAIPFTRASTSQINYTCDLLALLYTYFTTPSLRAITVCTVSTYNYNRQHHAKQGLRAHKHFTGNLYL